MGNKIIMQTEAQMLVAIIIADSCVYIMILVKQNTEGRFLILELEQKGLLMQ